ncbi:MAG TPA: TOBE domain-containing protein, partial [Vicinamibacteria bacterium]|nr:TOBE domain-containing protein [Vicinamibacteria bacterium]
AVRAEDVLVSTEALRGLSARNMYEARVEAVEGSGPDVTVRLTVSGAAVLARVSPQAVEALGLAAGRQVYLAVKSHSVRVA